MNNFIGNVYMDKKTLEETASVNGSCMINVCFGDTSSSCTGNFCGANQYSGCWWFACGSRESE